MQQETADHDSLTTDPPLTIDMVSVPTSLGPTSLEPTSLEPTEHDVEELLAAYNKLRFQMDESAKGLRALLERLKGSPHSTVFEDGISQNVNGVIESFKEFQAKAKKASSEVHEHLCLLGRRVEEPPIEDIELHGLVDVNARGSSSTDKD